MGVFIDRVSVLSAYAAEGLRHGLPEFVHNGGDEIVMLLDGVGGFQFVPLLVRKVVREDNLPISTTWFRWQVPIPGLVLVDLMWRSRNDRRAAMLADKLMDLHRAHPAARIHLVGYSGGTAIAVFALEKLSGRVPIETLLLFAPALSPDYNLAPALRGVARAYIMTSPRDTWLLGAGTRLFGTMDRRHTRAAGLVGFRLPHGLSEQDRVAYQRLRTITWCESLRADGHRGGHTGWAQVPFLRRHFRDLLAGTPALAATALDSRSDCGNN
jgi:pimeloyl-ACP methyl ester carboxylesterase